MGKDTVTDARKTPPHSDGERHVTKGQQCRRLRVEILGLAECVPEQWKRGQQVPLRLAARFVLTAPEPAPPPLHLRCPHCGAFALRRIGCFPRPRPP